MSAKNEIWLCSHTKKCGWKGQEQDLVYIPTRKYKSINSTTGTCPKCGNKTFYVRCQDCHKPYLDCQCNTPVNPVNPVN